MRVLSEKETKQKERIEAGFSKYGIIDNGRHLVEKPFNVKVGGASVEINAVTIGIAPLTKREGVLLYVNCFQNEKAVAMMTFVPEDVTEAETKKLDIQNITCADYKLSGFDELKDLMGELKLDRKHYEDMISESKKIIAECEKFLQN